MKSTTRRCESDRLRGAVEQPHAKFLFQLSYRDRECRLRYGGPDRRLRETSGLYDRGEVSDLIEFHSINRVYLIFKNIGLHLWLVNRHMREHDETRTAKAKSCPSDNFPT